MGADKKGNVYLQIDKERADAVYLGYYMGLTMSEYAVVNVIINNSKPICLNDIVSQAGGSLFVKTSVPMLISNINKKAVRIGERKIIGCKRSEGYFINKYI